MRLIERTRKRRSERVANERGASAVEGALVLPLFLLLIAGIMEGAMLMQHRAEVRQATGAAVRAGSLSANQPDTDYQILRELRRALKSQVGTVSYVIVFRAQGPADRRQAPADCVNAAETGGTGVAGLCNVYTNAVLSNPDPNLFGYTVDEPTRTADQNWPARSRLATYSGGRDLLGIAVRASRTSVTRALPASTNTYIAVHRLEARGV